MQKERRLRGIPGVWYVASRTRGAWDIGFKVVQPSIIGEVDLEAGIGRGRPLEGDSIF